jgi:hypothetical protein
MPAVPTVLIELPGGEGVVRRDDGEVVLTRDVQDDDGYPLGGREYRPDTASLNDDRTLVGGLLPPGAVSAEVVDDSGTRITATAGGGAYATIVKQTFRGREPVVCCRDPDGRPVARPLPRDWTRAPVTDAEVPCPGCGAIAYDEVTPTDGSRGGRGGHGHDGPLVPGKVTVCRACGHEEGAGRAITRLGSIDEEPLDEAEAAERKARRRAHRRVEKWYLDELTLRGVGFPIYAAENWPGSVQIGGGLGTWGEFVGPQSAEADDVRHLTIDHYTSPDTDRFSDRPRLKVTTSVDDSRWGNTHVDQARWILGAWHQEQNPSWPEASDAALYLWLAARDRDKRALVHSAAESEEHITIDGAAEPFLMLSTPAGPWVAIRRHDDLTIILAARDADPATIMLEPIADPAVRLLGSEPHEA